MLDDIVLFTHLVEIGQFSKTAKKVHLSQATLSKRIIELENQLNKRLFIRDTRNIQLTEEGQVLYERFKGIRNELKQFLHDINPQDYSATNNIELNISLPVVLSYELICPYINNYITDNPHVKLNLYFQYKDNFILDNKFDVALTNYDIKSDKLYNKFLRKETSQLYCNPEYASKYGVPQTIDELKNHNIFGALHQDKIERYGVVSLTNKYNSEQFFYNNQKEAKITSNLITHIKKIGMNSDTIFISWSFLCDNEVTKGALIPVLPEYSTDALSFYLVTQKNLTAEAQRFCEFIHQCLGRHNTML